MDISEFVERSIGQWRSQRSAHHLIFSHFEAVLSEIDIVSLAADDPAVLDLCKSYDIDPQHAIAPFRMSWEGQSDWDEKEVLKGSTVLVPIPDPQIPDPTPTPLPTPEPAPSPVPEPVPSPVPQPIPSPVPEPVPAPIPQPVPAPIPQPIPEPV